METIFYILAKIVQIFLSVISFAMLLRVLLQFFVDIQKSKLYAISVALTEPIVVPFRVLFAKLNIAQNTPLDLPFMVAYLAVWLVGAFLPLI